VGRSVKPEAQLLVYAYYYKLQTGIASVELVVIAPGKLDQPADKYIQRLPTEFNSQPMMGHSNVKTTGLYDRRNYDIGVGEVEKIGI
jgi:hypothetical protein